MDETGWREGKKRGWLWAAVTACVTVFLVRLSRARVVLTELVGRKPGVITSDRFPVYDHLKGGGRHATRSRVPRLGALAARLGMGRRHRLRLLWGD